MTSKELLGRFKDIVVWKRGGKRAPHKPLLLLLAIRYAVMDCKRLISYSEIEKEFSELLTKYGPQRKSYRPQYPFWRLQNDGIWDIADGNKIKVNKAGDVSASELREKNVHGGFSSDIFDLLKENESLNSRYLVQFILDEHFPYSIHNEILEDLGLKFRVSSESLKRKRDPKFRNKVLHAYNHKCAVCGYDLRFFNKCIALEAAHIKWHKAGGPDIEENGVALCTLHHKLFDFGAIALSSDRRLVISGKLQGSNDKINPLLDMHQEFISTPQMQSHYPKQEYISWHHREVFKEKNKT